MNIAISGPDILLSDGGAQRHMINMNLPSAIFMP